MGHGDDAGLEYLSILRSTKVWPWRRDSATFLVKLLE